MEIKQVIEKAIKQLEADRHSGYRIATYKWLWKKGIQTHMDSKGIVDFDEEVGNGYLQSLHDGGTVTFTHRDLIKSVDVLINVVKNGTLGKRMRIRAQYPFRGAIGNYAKEYLESLRSRGVSETKTIPTYRKMLSVFTEYLFDEGIKAPSDISEDVIVRFIESRHHRTAEYIGQTRRFMRYLQSNGYVANSFSYMLTNMGKKICHVKVPSFYSPDEVHKLEESISRTSDVGKRDYAIVLLCSRLGLRVSDVADLKFSDIDWEGCRISKIQYKTGNPILLPLLPVVGNAIIDYLKNARPKSSLDNIFLSCRPPYGAMSGGSIHLVVAVAFRKSGLMYEGRHHGGHSLRFSLAQRMLDQSTPIPVISETLGHVNVDMTRTYVRIDTTHMRRCMLEVPYVSDDFYSQRGGWFYD